MPLIVQKWGLDFVCQELREIHMSFVSNPSLTVQHLE